MNQSVQNVCVSVLTSVIFPPGYQILLSSCENGPCCFLMFPDITLDSLQIITVVLQVLCMRGMRCKANGVDDCDPSAPRTEKTTSNDCILLSPCNQVYHDPQSSQVSVVVRFKQNKWKFKEQEKQNKKLHYFWSDNVYYSGEMLTKTERLHHQWIWCIRFGIPPT